MTVEAELTVESLSHSFRELGLVSGDSLILHSSLGSLGWVNGGPEAVIQALLEVVGFKGNLMLPTFNYTRPLPEPYFDPAATPGRTGIIPEAGRKWPGAVRSLHPTHSVAVIGPDAELLTKDHLACRAFGMGSPIDRLAQMGGKVLLLGVGHVSNSAVHVGEEYAGTPKVSWYDKLPMIKIRLPDGSIIRHQCDTSPSCSSAFGAAECALRRKGQIRDARIGRSKLQLMDGSQVIERVQEMIQEKPDVLLCTWPGCKPCSGARENLRCQRLIA